MPGGSQQQTTVAGAGTIGIWIFGIGLMNFLLGAVLNATLDLPTRLSYIREASRPSNTPQRTAVHPPVRSPDRLPFSNYRFSLHVVYNYFRFL